MHIKREIRAAQYRATIHVNSDMLIAFPESKGYSVRNLKYMAKFAETYPDREFVQQVVAQIPWGHNIVLLDKVADIKMLRNLGIKIVIRLTFYYICTIFRV